MTYKPTEKTRKFPTKRFCRSWVLIEKFSISLILVSSSSNISYVVFSFYINEINGKKQKQKKNTYKFWKSSNGCYYLVIWTLERKKSKIHYNYKLLSSVVVRQKQNNTETIACAICMFLRRECLCSPECIIFYHTFKFICSWKMRFHFKKTRKKSLLLNYNVKKPLEIGWALSIFCVILLHQIWQAINLYKNYEIEWI